MPPTAGGASRTLPHHPSGEGKHASQPANCGGGQLPPHRQYAHSVKTRWGKRAITTSFTALPLSYLKESTLRGIKHCCTASGLADPAAGGCGNLSRTWTSRCGNSNSPHPIYKFFPDAVSPGKHKPFTPQRSVSVDRAALAGPSSPAPSHRRAHFINATHNWGLIPDGRVLPSVAPRHSQVVLRTSPNGFSCFQGWVPSSRCAEINCLGGLPRFSLASQISNHMQIELPNEFCVHAGSFRRTCRLSWSSALEGGSPCSVEINPVLAAGPPSARSTIRQ